MSNVCLDLILVSRVSKHSSSGSGCTAQWTKIDTSIRKTKNCFLVKDWILKKQTKVYSRFLLKKFQTSFLFFRLHLLWLWKSWHHQRILKKLPFWKYDGWFSSEVSKFTSVFYLWNDAFSCMKRNILITNNIITLDPINI